MKQILLSLVLLLSALVMTSATMNVGTFWFAQNNGKFYPVGASNGYYDKTLRTDENTNDNGLQERQQEVRQLLFANWWNHYNFWNKMIRFR